MGGGGIGCAPGGNGGCIGGLGGGGLGCGGGDGDGAATAVVESCALSASSSTPKLSAAASSTVSADQPGLAGALSGPVQS